MERDLIYAFDKLTFIGTKLGEIQSDFNMSFVIDGTKDSTKVRVMSFNETELEPYTIIYHPKTETWWVVSSDKVERYMNENDANNNQSFFYIHNIELLGAIELLNARDLTDCGFNDRTYTVSDFILRLFSLSNFEYNYNAEYFFQANDNFLTKTVDFIKTFENYTLLSALREFLDAYNMSAKMSFSATYHGNEPHAIDYPMLYIIPKTGDYNLTSHNIEDFESVRETRTIDKNSFGTCVVSNVENVISSKDKTYPATGSVRLSSTNYLIVEGTSLNNGVIRLPSKVFKGNWIKIIHPLQMDLIIQGLVTKTYSYSYLRTDASFDKMIAYFSQKILDETASQATVDMFLSYVNDELKKNLNLACATTLYNDNEINAYTGEIVKGETTPYLANLIFGSTSKPVMFADKDTKDCLKDIKQGIAWERGSNIISGFDMFNGSDRLDIGSHSTDYQGNFNLIQFTKDNVTFTLRIGTQTLKYVYTGSQSLAKQLSKLSFIINYIPMSDVKVKVDNQRNKKDIQLYNQNGRVTDSVALSKLLNSYSKEISSDSITRYNSYYDFNDIPKVGSIVYVGNIPYVVNNVSLNFSQNEYNDLSFGYFIDAEITMSKYTTTKSIMVNPNTNIRDYGIPQNYNVKRKQLYRDYYELGYGIYDGANKETPYLSKNYVFDFNHLPNELPNFIGVIQLGYNDLVEGEYNWYYQLETTNYQLEKMLYIVLDFNDNNIIGYGSQNVFSGFDVSRILTGMTDTLNSPISYTDENGQVESIDLLLLTNEQITTIYNEYQNENSGSTWDGSLYNYSVFIPSDIYNKALNNHMIQISEPNYYKDALEVPVFEYACQIDDSEDVLIGDNILAQHDECIYFYSYVVGENLTQNNVVQSNSVVAISSPIGWQINDSATIEYETLTGSLSLLRIRTYQRTYYKIDDQSWHDVSQQDITLGLDYAIFRHAYNLRTQEEIKELMFIAKKVPYSHVSNNNILTLEINHYKLK